MNLSIYADPTQGITLSVIGDASAHAIPTFYDEYMDEVVALLTVYGNKIKNVTVFGNDAYAAKIAREIEAEYPNMVVEYAWKEDE